MLVELESCVLRGMGFFQTWSVVDVAVMVKRVVALERKAIVSQKFES